jgi:hypothetical protein
MIVTVNTASGARYTFNNRTMKWMRYHPTKEITGLPPDKEGLPFTSGELIEWPVINLGYRVMFDDTKVGVVYTTQVMAGYVEF